MYDNIHDVVDNLHPSILNFIRDLNDEDLKQFRQAVKDSYESIAMNNGANKLRSVRLYGEQTISVLLAREHRQVAGLKKFFNHYNDIAGLSDKQLAQVVDDELWATQSIYGRESALLENIVDRLNRSENGGLKTFNAEDFKALVEALT